MKTNKSGQREGGITAIGGGRFRATNIPFKILPATAYDVNFEQISGGLDWLDSERFDVEAKPDRLATTRQNTPDAPETPGRTIRPGAAPRD